MSRSLDLTHTPAEAHTQAMDTDTTGAWKISTRCDDPCEHCDTATEYALGIAATQGSRTASVTFESDGGRYEHGASVRRGT